MFPFAILPRGRGIARRRMCLSQSSVNNRMPTLGTGNWVGYPPSLMTLAMENLSGLVGLSRDGFSVEQLEDCAKCLRGALLQDFVFCKGHPFMTRLSATLERGSDAERGAALEAMAWVAKNPANSEPILFALEESGESLEKYTAQHTHLDGHRDKADDAIYRNLLSLLMCSSGFTFRASQLLELTDGKMGTALAALAAVLRGPFGQPPMQELLKGDPLLWRSNVQLVTCAIKVLCDFTTCDAYFLSTDARDYQSIDIVQLNKEFTRSITEVSRALLQYPIFDLIAVHLEEWFQVVKKGCSSSMQVRPHAHTHTHARTHTQNRACSASTAPPTPRSPKSSPPPSSWNTSKPAWAPR